MNKYSLSVRRENLMRAVQQEQRELFRSQCRSRLQNLLNPLAEVWRLKETLPALNPQYYPAEMAEIINYMLNHTHDLDFCREVADAGLLQDLLVSVAGDLSRRPSLQAPELAALLVQLLFQLLLQWQGFTRTLELHFCWLPLLLLRYPLHPTLLTRTAQLATFLQTLPSPLWKQTYRQRCLVADADVVGALAKSYLLSGEGVERGGFEGGEGGRGGGREEWVRNAVKSMEISCILMHLHEDREGFWLNGLLSHAVMTAIARRESARTVDCEYSDCETINEGETELARQEESSDELYLLSLLLDVLSLRAELLNEREISVLKDRLVYLLRQLPLRPQASMPAIKIIRIFYEQVVLDADQMQELALEQPQLRGLIEQILSSDLV